MIFDGTQKIIGKGAQAEVVSYQGYAYKLYRDAYPREWIAFEKKQQQAINKAGLSSVRYYDTDNGPEYIIIDWMNARLAPPVFDYARTYVIFEEFSEAGLNIYIEKVLHQMWETGVSENDFYDAVKVCRMIRKQEKR